MTNPGDFHPSAFSQELEKLDLSESPLYHRVQMPGTEISEMYKRTYKSQSFLLCVCPKVGPEKYTTPNMATFSEK